MVSLDHNIGDDILDERDLSTYEPPKKDREGDDYSMSMLDECDICGDRRLVASMIRTDDGAYICANCAWEIEGIG